MRMIRLGLLLLYGLASPMISFGHGGGLDSLGCHNDRSKGNYHCHRGPLAGQTFPSKAEALKAIEKLKQKDAEQPKGNNPRN